MAAVDCLGMTGSFWCHRNTVLQLDGKEQASSHKAHGHSPCIARPTGTELHKPKARKRVGLTVSGLAPKRRQTSRYGVELTKRIAVLAAINRLHRLPPHQLPHSPCECSLLLADCVEVDGGGVGIGVA
jgi:hypothetical protein